MTSSRKRPCLYRVGSISPEAEDRLEAERTKNDNLLKNKFESIFLRYDKSFKAQADEIDLWTGEVVVDNGHLSGMKALRKEKRHAAVRRSDGTKDYGSAILQAISMAQGPASDLPPLNVEDILPSIETVTIDGTENESEDELFESGLVGALQHAPTSISCPNHTDLPHLVQSSPFPGANHHQELSSSPDSLIGASEARRMPVRSTPSYQDEILTPRDTRPLLGSSVYMPTHEEMLKLYAPFIKQQVDNALKEQKDRMEMRIEPAWRLPNLPSPLSTKHKRMHRLPGHSLDTVTDDDNEFYDLEEAPQESDDSTDLWRPSRPKRKKRLPRSKVEAAVERQRTRIRAESEDPLQIVEPDEASESPVALPVRANSQKKRIEMREPPHPHLLRESEHKGRPSTKMKRPKHSASQLSAKSEVVLTSDTIHPYPVSPDADDVASEPISVYDKKRGRPKKLPVMDFCALVQLHEAGGQSFDQIAATHTFGKGKTSTDLLMDYDRHRDPQVQTRWSEEETCLIYSLCRLGHMTTGILKFKLEDKTYIDIGNKLADIALDAVEGMNAQQVAEFVRSVRYG